MTSQADTCSSVECQECFHDPDSECITKHPQVWINVYDPALQKCEIERRQCEHLQRLLKAVIKNVPIPTK